MRKRLTQILNPRTLQPTISDIAKAVQKPVEKVYFPEDKEWKWQDMFYILVEGEGARFGSYRALVCWLEAIIQMLTNCKDWQKLAEIIVAVEWELDQDYPYLDEHKRQLKEVVAAQKIRLAELKAQAAALDKAWEWAKGWVPVLETCSNRKTLNMAKHLYKAQKSQFTAYPQVFEFIQQIGEQRREYLTRLETP